MNYNWFFKFYILLIFLLVCVKTAVSQGCDINGLNCISCTKYQTCRAGTPQQMILSCTSGNQCEDDKLKQCQMKLNCYELNKCIQNGIFPDVIVDSNFFVCLSDGGTGFIKYEFSCPDGNFFDEFGKSCTPRDVTATDSPSESTTPDPGSTTSSETTPPESTTSSETTPPESTTSSETTPPESTTSSGSTTSSETTPPESTTSSGSTTSSETTTPSESTTPSGSTPLESTTPSGSTTSSKTTTPSESTTPSKTTTPSETTTPPSEPTTTPFVCPGPGIFPNSDNCKMYYRCSTSLKLFFYICPGRSYFNSNILKCSMRITPECQEQISKNSSSTLPPRITTSPTTKPTPPQSATTNTTPGTPPATTISSSTPFSCTMAGTFENPNDCKTYYRCSNSLKAFRYICPGETYFNEITKRCSLTVTSRCKKLMKA